MSQEEDQVRTFYEIIWNKYDKEVIPDIVHRSFTFRGSLGAEKQGHSGFIEYLDMVHTALGEYRCIIKEMVSEPSTVFARMQFTGIHQGKLMGVRPTGRTVTWDGAALFHFKEGKVFSLWVLGDLIALQEQLNEHQP